MPASIDAQTVPTKFRIEATEKKILLNHRTYCIGKMLLDRVMADQLIMQKKKNLKHIKMR